ncbi:MAG TPA: hypothetical protein VGJ55_10460 [Pyrinomonadaceae bacterium]
MAFDDTSNRQLAIGNVTAHLLPHGGTDLMGPLLVLRAAIKLLHYDFADPLAAARALRDNPDRYAS